MKELISYTTVNKKGKEILTDVSLHSGEVLMMELEARGIEYWMRVQVYYDLFIERNKDAKAA